MEMQRHNPGIAAVTRLLIISKQRVNHFVMATCRIRKLKMFFNFHKKLSMKKILVAAAIMLSLSSCYTYEYLRVDAPGMTTNNFKDLVWENDTVRLTYNFHGKNGPMKLSIYNKTGKALFIDWKRSALIRDQQSVSLFDSRMDWSGNAAGVSFAVARQVNYHKGVYSGTMNLPEGVEMIAPQAYINKNLFPVYDGRQVFDSLAAGSLAAGKMKIQSGSIEMKYTSATYPDAASPLKFRTYLTFVLGNMHEGSETFSLTHAFYVSGMMRSTLGPDDFSLYGNDGNQFYLREKTN
jgi:hypothetical protein